MKSAKEILENLVDALLEAEPILHDAVREPLRRANEKLGEIETLAGELRGPSNPDKNKCHPYLNGRLTQRHSFSS